MRRLHATINNGQVTFDNDTIKHAKVLRLNLGEQLELVTSSGVYLGSVDVVHPLVVKLLNKLDIDRELPIKLTLFLPLIKNGNFDLALQKAVELGVSEIIPFRSSRTILKISDEDYQKRRSRYDKIILEAIEQSNRDIIFKINDIIDFDDIMKFNFDAKYVPYEGETLSDKTFSLSTRFVRGSSIGLVIGPEGGFADFEIKMLIDNGYSSLSLGKRILRSETAVISACSLIAHYAEVKDEI